MRRRGYAPTVKQEEEKMKPFEPSKTSNPPVKLVILVRQWNLMNLVKIVNLVKLVNL